MEKIDDIYYNLPYRITKFTNVIIKRGIIRFLNILKNIFFEVSILTGEEKNSGETISILICGNKRTLYYIPKRIFSGNYSVNKLGKFPIWKIKKLVSENEDNVDLIFLNIDCFLRHFLENNDFFIIPEWIDMEVDTSRPLGHIYNNFSHGAKRDIKKIEKFGFDYEVTKDPKKIDNFYYNMFLPHINEKHSEETPKNYLRYIKSLSKEIEVILIKEKGKDVCGGMIEQRGNKSRLPSMGVLNSDMDLIKKCVISALYYFHIVYAKERNIKSLDYGETRAFLNDGCFQFKRKWGLKAVRSEFESGIIGLKICKNDDATKNYLMNNPFIFIKNNKFYGMFYNNKNSPTTLNEIKQFFKSYYTPGLSELFIISPNGFTKECKTFSFCKNYIPKKFDKGIGQITLSDKIIQIYKTKKHANFLLQLIFKQLY